MIPLGTLGALDVRETLGYYYRCQNLFPFKKFRELLEDFTKTVCYMKIMNAFQYKKEIMLLSQNCRQLSSLTQVTICLRHWQWELTTIRNLSLEVLYFLVGPDISSPAGFIRPPRGRDKKEDTDTNRTQPGKPLCPCGPEATLLHLDAGSLPHQYSPGSTLYSWAGVSVSSSRGTSLPRLRKLSLPLKLYQEGPREASNGIRETHKTNIVAQKLWNYIKIGNIDYKSGMRPKQGDWLLT